MNKSVLISELSFKFVRAGGAGGQHVNKVSSKVQLLWSIADSQVFSAEQKSLISQQLSNRINKEGFLFLEVDSTRSQLQNKEIAIERFLNMIQSALEPMKPRKQTKVPHAVVKKRLEKKSQKSDLKSLRKKVDIHKH